MFVKIIVCDREWNKKTQTRLVLIMISVISYSSEIETEVGASGRRL